ncbi:hypothetical protein AQUCO_03700043v1 [Aquilegia coerulea]|uniref:Uncharacterized protein n=1 Tax=Aquilegia coerulea TaxID=218851 RepID=A0A2G5CT83_AQUCA|nr:hypothetical protein AQUCO_03700043v1 [Aquilegia coerulea]
MSLDKKTRKANTMVFCPGNSPGDWFGYFKPEDIALVLLHGKINNCPVRSDLEVPLQLRRRNRKHEAIKRSAAERRCPYCGMLECGDPAANDIDRWANCQRRLEQETQAQEQRKSSDRERITEFK